MTISELLMRVDAWCWLKGWRDRERTIPEKVALEHTELSEVMEAFREHGADPSKFLYYEGEDRKPCGIASEYADLLIRVFDTCTEFSIPIEEALKAKLDYNDRRAHRHGGKHA